MPEIGDRLIEKLRLANERGGWLKAGFGFGQGNSLHRLVERNLMRADGQGDFAVTSEGKSFLRSGRKQKHRAV